MKRTDYQNCKNCRFCKPWTGGDMCMLKKKTKKNPFNYVCESFEVSSEAFKRLKKLRRTR